jgi:YD repeat-containing protein
VEGNHYTLSWNKQSNLTKFIDPQGGEYRFHYDDMGNLELAVNPLGEVSSIISITVPGI